MKLVFCFEEQSACTRLCQLHRVLAVIHLSLSFMQHPVRRGFFSPPQHPVLLCLGHLLAEYFHFRPSQSKLLLQDFIFSDELLVRRPL